MSELLDLGLAERVAGTIAGSEPEVPAADEDRLRELAVEASRSVLAYTGLEPARPLPTAEWVSRREWSRINLAGLSDAASTLEERIHAGTELPEPIGPAARALLRRLASLQAGALVGYASRRVLGQYELPLLGSDRPPRLVFVAANIDGARTALGTEREPLLQWIALHEVTHAVHFSAVPWLREHLGSLVRELLGDAEIGPAPAELLAVARRAVSGEGRELLGQLRESDPLMLLAGPRSRQRLAAIQAAMSVVEGFAEHVMDAAAGELGEAVPELRAGLERRRSERGRIGAMLAWLLGIELKLRQYREGKRFVDAVVAGGGLEALNRGWSGPEALPTPAELADPERWLERTGSVGASDPVV